MKKCLLLICCVFSLRLFAQQNIILGRTVGRLPFLDYGLGEDRLGGAKMGYLDTNVFVKVIDSIKNVYKVELSKNHIAYLSKNNFRRDTSIKMQASYLTSSWRVWGDDKYDYVSIGLPERLPYKSSMQICPSKIVIDIYGAVSNTNWITQLQTVKEVSNVWYEQVEDDVFRVNIDLQHVQHWGYFVYYNKNALQIRIKRQPKSLKPKNLFIAIDAGHGGAQEGADGLTSKVKEKEYTLKIAKQVQAYLEKRGFTVFMTRTQDTDITMIDRTLILRQQDPNFMLSIHLNSSGNSKVQGVSTYYRYVGFRPLTQFVLNRMLQLGLNNFGNVGAFNFSLSGPTEYPNCLVEVAFLSNEEDEKKILDEHFHKAVAKQIYKGIKDWLKWCKQ
ncbi:MAG: N-acetylmuramoyl-L-alanine amidase [Chitinophagaceae bacterium]